MEKLIKVVCAAFLLVAVVGCSGGTETVAPKAANPDPNLQPASRGPEGGGSPATTGEATAP